MLQLSCWEGRLDVSAYIHRCDWSRDVCLSTNTGDVHPVPIQQLFRSAAVPPQTGPGALVRRSTAISARQNGRRLRVLRMSFTLLSLLLACLRRKEHPEAFCTLSSLSLSVCLSVCCCCLLSREATCHPLNTCSQTVWKWHLWLYFWPFDAHCCCHIDTAVKHPAADRVKPPFVIFDIRALWRSVLSVRVLGCQKWEMAALPGLAEDGAVPKWQQCASKG